QKESGGDPDLVNEVFRAVHTLKGIAGMFGYHQLGAVAHALEDLLDDLRLGRVALSQEVLDVLFEGVENFQRLLSDEENALAGVNLDAYAASIERVSGKGRAAVHDPLSDYDIDPGVMAVLTEYEEHRLRTNLQQGLTLYRLHVRFSLASIDTLLEDLKRRAKPVAEIITYLPSMDGGDGDHIELDVLLASGVSAAQLSEVLDARDEALRVVPRVRGGSRTQVDTPVPDGGSDTPIPDAPIPAPPVPRELNDAARGEDRGHDRDVTADQLSLRSVANTVRVDIRKLDHLMNVVGELAIVRSSVARLTERIRRSPELRHLALELHRVNRGFERHLEELQDGILDVRMVPLGQVFDKLARIVRQVAREHEKEVRLVVTGAETEVDKLIVEELSDPLMHIIRNAIDHGIEPPKARELAGKPATGTLALNAFQKGNHVLIEIEDDGAGMDEAKLLEAAVRKGMISRELSSEISREEAFNFIFAPGFSTSAAVTDISGRGVGMDVVKTNISRLGGVIDVQSETGIGSKFTITLPVTLAIISALLVRVRDRWYALPITSVQEAIALDEHAVRTVEGREVLTLRGSTLPICRLERLFDLAHIPRVDAGRQYVVVSALGHRRLGFVVDALAGQQDIVIKALGPSLRDIRGFAGATDLGDQRVALVLDAPGLLEEVLSGSEAARMRVRA
ncbi:MAG: chemotaxis protein CheA, partial [Myxococcales bacterium]|nr:chemotaxis protein CheA [Myxococcales bacterium]